MPDAIGGLRELITIQQAVSTTDVIGGRSRTWETLISSEPAELVTSAALDRPTTEGIQATAVQSSIAYRFRIRVRAGLAPTMRVLWTPRWPPSATTKTLEIIGISPIGNGAVYMAIDCVGAQS